MTERMQQERVQFFSDLFEAEAALFDHWKIPEIRAKGTNRVVAVLPLNSHKFYGETVLSIQENYGEAAAIREYRYAWELQDVKKKVNNSAISLHLINSHTLNHRAMSKPIPFITIIFRKTQSKEHQQASSHWKR